MKIEFQKHPFICMKERVAEVLYQEETAELIVPDIYPDVQSVADASAVCCIRDQEILHGSMTVSGGFQASIVFLSEEPEEVCIQDAWLPFVTKLNREEITGDSFGCAEVRIRSVDARMLNSRKVLLRVSYAVRMVIYGEDEIILSSADCKEPVQLLQSVTEATVPVCAAEKTFSFSDKIEIPTMAAPVIRLCKAVPSWAVQEQKLMDGRAVFQGELRIRILCLLENGAIASFDTSLPVSQYLDLREPLEEGKPQFCCSLSDFRLEEDTPGNYLANIGVRLQVVIWKNVSLSVVEDGYCIGHSFDAEFNSIPIRQLLDEPAVIRQMEAPLRGKPARLVDTTIWADFPVCKRTEDEVTIGTSAVIHAMYYDDNGKLCGETVRGEAEFPLVLHKDAICYADADCTGGFYIAGSDGDRIGANLHISCRCFGNRILQTMCSAEVGNETPGEADRPSLIVRRTGRTERLWDLAKQYHTSVAKICEANGLIEPDLQEDFLLLIPVV